MKYIDFIGQALLLLTALVLTFVFFGTGILIGQFLLGGWQMLSSAISVVSNAPLRKKKVIHLVASILYLTLLAIIYANSWWSTNAIAFVVLMAPSWILAIYYFSVTWAWAFAQKTRSKFLPNISF